MVDRELKRGARATQKAGSTVGRIVPKGSVKYTGDAYDQLAQTLTSASRVLTLNDPLGALEDAWNYGDTVKAKRLQDIVDSKLVNRMSYHQNPIRESKSLDRQIASVIRNAPKLEAERRQLFEAEREAEAIRQYLERRSKSAYRRTRGSSRGKWNSRSSASGSRYGKPTKKKSYRAGGTYTASRGKRKSVRRSTQRGGYNRRIY